MKAIILAAGRGCRMGNMTAEQPKCMTQFAGKALVKWQLDALTGAGVREIGIVRGYLADKLLLPDIKTFYNERWAATNMVMSLACADIWLKNEPCIVSYSDIVYGSSCVQMLIDVDCDLAITYDPNWLKLWQVRFANPLSDAETFKTDNDGYLVEIGSKASCVDEIKGQYMGLLRFTPTGWGMVEQYLEELLPDQRDKLDMTSLLRALISRSAKIKAVPIASQWFEVDNENDLNAYKLIIETNGLAL
jgi:choline kinase